MAGIKGKINAKDLQKFKETIDKMNAQTLQQWNEAALKELAARLWRNARFLTPEGKSLRPDKEERTIKVKGASGKTRTFMSAEEARYQQYWSGYVGGTLRKGWTISEVRKSGNSYEIDVINPIKYAPYVEFGHRQEIGRFVPALGKKLINGWVEGKFMLTISEQELQADAPRILIDKMKRFLNGQ